MDEGGKEQQVRGGGEGKRKRMEGAANEWTREARNNRGGGRGGEGKRKRVEGAANEWRREARSNQCCGSGSGIRCLFDPWIRDPGSGIRNDPKSIIWRAY
jgi:hypothetical protein